MSNHSLLDGLGLSDELDMIWTRTHEAIARRGYKIKCPPGSTSAELGEGTFAAVFYAEHIQDKTPVAIKIFKDNDADKVASFKREAETLRSPDFPRQFAITTYDAWHEPESQPFIVMEFIRGQPIHEYCDKQALDQPRRIELIEQALRGLQELHHRNIQHRDISVVNIFIDDQGRVRYLDFGLAGEIIRATRHTTIDARGNRAYSPAEVVKGDKKADAKDDIFACGMLAVHVLTGDAPPENVTQSGDPEHIARCKRQLSERGVSGKLTSIVLRGLGKPEHRYSQPDAMADALFHYRVRRPRRIRAFWIGLVMLFLLMCLGAVGWWRYDQLQRDSALRDYTELIQQTKNLPYAGHKAVAGRFLQAEQLRKQWKEQFDAGDREEGMATLAREMTVLQEAVDISRGLERCLPRLEALGIPLNDTPWIDQSPVIAKRRTELLKRYQDVTVMLNEGRIDDAWQAIDALQVTMAELTRDNTEAGAAAAIRSEYNALAASVCERLQEEGEFAVFGELAELAENAWAAGDWKQTNMLFGQAKQELSEWLKAHETSEERAARTKAAEKRIAALEAQRDQHAQRANELEKRIDGITLDRGDAVDDSNSTRESAKQDVRESATLEPLALHWYGFGQRFEDDGWRQFQVQDGVVMHSGDQFRLVFSPLDDCHVYVVNVTSGGAVSQLFPTPAIQLQNPCRRNHKYEVPDGVNWFTLDDKTGVETLYLVASVDALPNLQSLLRKVADGSSSQGREEEVFRIMDKIEDRDPAMAAGVESTRAVVIRPDHRLAPKRFKTPEHAEEVRKTIQGFGSVVQRIQISHVSPTTKEQ